MTSNDFLRQYNKQIKQMLGSRETYRRKLSFEDSKASGSSIWIDQIDLILQKSIENRNHAENAYVKKLFTLKYFQELAKYADHEIVKYIVKNSKVIRLGRRQFLFRKNDPKDCYYVVLKGKIGIEHEPSLVQKASNPNKISSMLKVLTNFLEEIQSKSPRKRVKRPERQQFGGIPFRESHGSIFHQLPISQINFKDEIGEQDSIGDSINNIYSIRKYNAIAMQDSILLEMSFSSFLKAIKFNNDRKLDQQHEFFRKFRCFDLFEDDELKNLIQRCKTDERAKNQYIFKQLQQASKFFLLYEGEVCLIKTAQLFVSNPNELYANRKAYINSKRRSDQLPYANLEKLYNYRPKQEKVQLGILEKNNIFGEEQTFLRTPRQTDAKVCSNIARYYVVQLAHLEAALKQKKYLLVDFKNFLFANLTRKKIMYRQEKFAEVLNLRNRNQLDYFFIDENQKEDAQAQTKYNIQKINRRVIESAKNTRKQQQSSQTDPEIKPFYNTFNFTKMLSQKQIINSDDPETKQQRCLMNLTHTTHFIDKQLHSERKFNKFRNPTKYKITLNDPLFEPDYFENLNKQSKKIQQQYKKMRFSFKTPDQSNSKSRPKSSITKRSTGI